MQNPAVEIIEGTLDNETVLDRAASCGASIFVSFSGPRIGTKGTVRYSLKPTINEVC